MDRAYSNWTHLWCDGLEPEERFMQACMAEPERVAQGWAPIWRYLELGRYGEQLEDLFRWFPRTQVHILRYRDLVDEHDRSLDGICEFLGVDTGLVSEAPLENVSTWVAPTPVNQALQLIWRQVLDPANRYADQKEPWKLVKSDRDAARRVLFDLVEPLRAAAVLLKPFLPRSAGTIYRSFNFPTPWEQVRCADAATAPRQAEDLRVLAALEGGKVKPLFPRIG